MRVVRCAVYTLRRLQGNRNCLQAKLLENKFTLIFLQGEKTFVILAILAILVGSTKLKRRKKIETNCSIPRVPIAVPIFHVLQLVVAGIVNVLGYTDLVSPLVFSRPKSLFAAAGKSSLVQLSVLDH